MNNIISISLCAYTDNANVNNHNAKVNIRHATSPLNIIAISSPDHVMQHPRAPSAGNIERCDPDRDALGLTANNDELK